ncbi:MAG: hypothetical protein ACK502_00460 [Alphaproteobacteria bacterium]
MTHRFALAALLVTTSLNVAIAQEAPNSQTLEEQMQRVESGKPAVPATWNQGQSIAPAAGQQIAQDPAAQPQVAAPSATPVVPVIEPATPAGYYTSRPSVAPDGEVFDSRGGDAIPALPLEIRTVGDIRYITGGVGDEEKAQLAMVENDFNMRLLITGNAGAFISGAMVRVMDKDNRLVLSTDGAGPYLYAFMPAGTYTFEVTAPEGGIKTAKVTVPPTAFVKPVMRFTE